jgi:hypothetical protein
MKTLPMHLAGKWSGTNRLILSWLPNPEHLSPSEMTAGPDVRGLFLRLTYTWQHEGTAHEGTILIGYDRGNDVATAAWADSWHQGARVMACEGSLGDDGTVNVKGSYPAPPDPDWGWRIVLTPVSENRLTLEMFNITPDGTEDLAVRTEYLRAG